jgi:hypothetical protein
MTKPPPGVLEDEEEPPGVLKEEESLGIEEEPYLH